MIWIGPMRVMKHHDANPGSPFVCFAEIVCRDPFSIVGDRPNPDFRPADLSAMKFATISEVPTPWLCLKEDLRQAGIDPTRLDRVSDRTMADNLEALRQGWLDAAQLFEPAVEQALASEIGHLWHTASSRGRTTYTALVTTGHRLSDSAEALLRMVRAVFGTQQWIHACSVQEIVAAIESFFPTLDRGVLAGSIARYQAQLIWGCDPVLPADGFYRLQRGLISSGFILGPVDYKACVDNTLAQRVIVELAGE